MNVDAAGGDKHSLCDQQNNPARKNRAMKVDKQVGQWSAKHAGKKISAGKADHNCNQD